MTYVPRIARLQIRAKGDWNRFKQLIGAETTTVTVDKYYRTRKSWEDSKSQIGSIQEFWKMLRKNGKKDIPSMTGMEKRYIRNSRPNRGQILLQN